MNDIVWDNRKYVRWFSSRPLSFKWMLWVILLFPFIAATWEMKRTIGVSPLQILGIFVFIFGFFSAILLKIKYKKSPLILKIFLFILLINLLFLNFYEANFIQFTDGIRTLLPFVLLLCHFFVNLLELLERYYYPLCFIVLLIVFTTITKQTLESSST